MSGTNVRRDILDSHYSYRIRKQSEGTKMSKKAWKTVALISVGVAVVTTVIALKLQVENDEIMAATNATLKQLADEGLIQNLRTGK